MYLSHLLIVAVANELATLRCVSLSVSASQERKQRGTDLIRDAVRVHFHLAAVRTGSVLQEAVSTVVHVRTSMLITSSELSASTADAVLEFSVSVLASASFASAPRHAVRNTVLPSGRFSPTVFSRLQAVFLRRSITADLDLKA